MTHNLFWLGTVKVSPRALQAMQAAGENTARELMDRHASGDWGEETSVRKGHLSSDRDYKSVYTLATGTRIQIVTTHRPAATHISLPDEGEN